MPVRRSFTDDMTESRRKMGDLMPERERKNGISLRFGPIAALYYHTAGRKIPKQMDVIEDWFPSLMIETLPSDGRTKIPADYADREFRIQAVKYNGSFYAGESRRVSQILGRLCGTAEGNREKERKTAELMQKHAAEQFICDMELTPRLKERAAAHLESLDDKQLEAFYDLIYETLYHLAEERAAADEYELKTEAFAMDDEVFDGVLYQAAYQLSQGTGRGLCLAYLWLLTGGLLRNEAGRVLRLYDSAFIAIRRQKSETGELTDKMDYLFHPEWFYDIYEGDDFKSRFPGIEWYCDGCGGHLNEQPGFDDHAGAWTCRLCGYENRLSSDEIYDNEEDWLNGIRKADPEKLEEAVERRRREKEK